MRIREIDNYKNYDNPTNAELKKDQEDADRMMDLKRASDYNKEFDWAPKYLKNTEKIGKAGKTQKNTTQNRIKTQKNSPQTRPDMRKIRKT